MDKVFAVADKAAASHRSRLWLAVAPPPTPLGYLACIVTAMAADVVP